jgi:integrase
VQKLKKHGHNAVPQRKRLKSQERVRKIENLAARPGTAGEQQAASAALVRIGPGAKALARAKAEGLTDAIIKRLPLPVSGARIIYDLDVPGFGIRITAGDFRAFVLNYRTKSGRERRYTIGEFPNWQTSAARKRARDLKKLVDEGGDPLAEIEAEREAPEVPDLIKRFEREHLSRKRPGTAADYQRILDKHVRPAFGKRKVAEITHDDIIRLHSKITRAGHAYRANAVVRVLSKAFSLAIRWGMRSDNPCKHLDRNPEAKRKRYLKGDELARLSAALAKHPDQRSANVFRLLLLTGARRGEVLGMRWADVDLSAGKWTKPGSTTKQKTEHEVPLSAPARQLLSEIRAAQTRKRRPLGEYVFPGNGDAQHIVNVKRAWRTICKAAEITGLRVHDLRHSFASQLVSSGASLPLIGALLGHSNPTTTHRYAHLFDDPLKAAVEKVGVLIANAGKPANGPTPLKQRSKRRA